MGNKPGIALVLGNQANLAASEGNYTEAQALYLECLRIYQEMGSKPGIPSSLYNLGCTAYDVGDMGKAQGYLVESLVLGREIGNLGQMSEGIDWLAAVALHNADAVRAVTLWAAVQTLRENQASPRQDSDEAKVKEWALQAREALDEATFASAGSEGIGLTWEQVLTLALQE